MLYGLWTTHIDGCDTEKYDVYVDVINFYPSDKKKVYVLCEPTIMMPNRITFLEKYHKEFDLIITYDASLLEKYSNAKLIPYGTTWIPTNIWDLSFEKENKISFWVGNKTFMPGHSLRQLIFMNLWCFRGVDLYLSRHHLPQHLKSSYKMILGDSKMPIFEKYKFHLCIENCRMDNYFTEKIMDCFLTRTIPVYWGCTNIEKYFNVKGIILLNDDFGKTVGTINNLNFSLYEELKDVIEENHKRAQQYINYWGSVANTINNLK